MYHSYFGIEEQVFSIAVNPRYMYMSAQHREALAHLLYGVNSGGFVMLTGEVGTGKTTTIRCLLEQLPANADVAMIMNPASDELDLMRSVCDEFGVEYDQQANSIKSLTDKLYAFLLENHSNGRNSIVLIDEAQLLRISTLEQIRLLTNLESHTQKMLQIILVGQPELNELLAKPALRQLSQRITARYHLRPLTQDETGAYIRHRLSVAGMPPGRDPFPASVVKKVHAISGGIPRLINILCDRMLLGAYSQESTSVDNAICKQATEEALGDPREKAFKSSRSLIKPLIYGCSAVLVVLILAILIWLLATREPEYRSGLDAMPAFSDASDTSLPTKDTQPTSQAQLATKAGRTGNGVDDKLDLSAESSDSLSLDKQQVGGVNAGLAESPQVAISTKPKIPLNKLVTKQKEAALKSLLRHLGVDEQTAIYPCWLAAKRGLYCEALEATTWQDFLAINRPAVLTLNMPSKHIAYATLVAMDEDNATLLYEGKQHLVSQDALGVLWTGEYVVIWQRPDLFKSAIGSGSTGPIVTWLANAFAELDQQSEPLATNRFNGPLERRVKLFQQQNALIADGLAGLQTFLRLNEALGREKPLLAPEDKRSENGSFENKSPENKSPENTNPAEADKPQASITNAAVNSVLLTRNAANIE